MNLDELRSVQSKERQKDSLQNLRPSFYQEVGEYIADLEDERDRVAEQAEDPFSEPEVGRLTDEIETAKDVVEAIYERRMGKLVKQASLAAAGMAADDEGLTAEEADLFDDLVDRISSNKSRVLDVLEGVEGAATGADAATDPTGGSEPPATGSAGDPETPPTGHAPSAGEDRTDDAPPAPPMDPPADTDPAAATAAEPDAGDASGVSPADVMGGNEPPAGATDAGAPGDPADPARDEEPTTPADSGAGTDSPPNAGDADPAADVDRTTVRITSDIGSILGVDDREYTLTSDDIVTLPEQNAAPLVDREAAERLE
ncbi:DNA replication complex subunit Gins51 [Natrinema salaciae]|uniref:DNA replication factor GINS n=1 Tax=Natrinema salaciae TaxID=1186196 RepID=A0A1H9C5I2_9EURY|nr:DNA replication factor GINS [Natrinema salaciae]